ncbi:hypothetical protein BC834DRAFT_74433 [Gloeopeniophorella convolvens]|nr:hypothetical protein BC834DRAFT_74433 [Gloeopeniophorella convolvens]
MVHQVGATTDLASRQILLSSLCISIDRCRPSLKFICHAVSWPDSFDQGLWKCRTYQLPRSTEQARKVCRMKSGEGPSIIRVPPRFRALSSTHIKNSCRERLRYFRCGSGRSIRRRFPCSYCRLPSNLGY